jgi:hypothetical protein
LILFASRGFLRSKFFDLFPVQGLDFLAQKIESVAGTPGFQLPFLGEPAKTLLRRFQKVRGVTQAYFISS